MGTIQNFHSRLSVAPILTKSTPHLDLWRHEFTTLVTDKSQVSAPYKLMTQSIAILTNIYNIFLIFTNFETPFFDTCQFLFLKSASIIHCSGCCRFNMAVKFVYIGCASKKSWFRLPFLPCQQVPSNAHCCGSRYARHCKYQSLRTAQARSRQNVCTYAPRSCQWTKRRADFLQLSRESDESTRVSFWIPSRYMCFSGTSHAACVDTGEAFLAMQLLH